MDGDGEPEVVLHANAEPDHLGGALVVLDGDGRLDIVSADAAA